MLLSHDARVSTLHDPLQELAAIFATGVRRLIASQLPPDQTPARLSESAGDCLEIRSKTVLSVSHGLTVARPSVENHY